MTYTEQYVFLHLNYGNEHAVQRTLGPLTFSLGYRTYSTQNSMSSEILTRERKCSTENGRSSATQRMVSLQANKQS